jgi:hypothetical protein
MPRWAKVVIGVTVAVVALGAIGAVLEDDADEAQAVSTRTGQVEATNTTTTAVVTTTTVQVTTTTEPCPPIGEDTRTQCLYPDRPDSQSQDHEQLVGGSVRLAGYTATVHRVGWGEWLGQRCVLVEVTVENRDSGAQSFNMFDWKVQTDGGQVLNTSVCGFGQDSNIGSGSLVQGGSVTGTVGFDIGPGVHYVIFKPDAFNAARGVWQIVVE